MAEKAQHHAAMAYVALLHISLILLLELTGYPEKVTLRIMAEVQRGASLRLRLRTGILYLLSYSQHVT